jgi:Protein of unknown function (DUF2510)
VSPTGIPPGWHPDPQDPSGSLRWWDGTQWTSYVQPVSPPSYSPSSPGQETPTFPPPASSGSGPADRSWGSSNGGSGGWSAGFGSAGGWDRPAGPSGIEWGANGNPRYPKQTFMGRNRSSIYAIGLCIFYLVLATVTHFVPFGIFPILLSVRGLQRREPLAPVAIAASVLVLVVAIAVVAHH